MDINSILSASLGKTSVSDVVYAVITSLVCLVIIRVLLKLLRRILSASKLDQKVQRYTLTATKALLYILAAIIVISSLNVDMTSLVALLSVGSLGITLAAEDILGNMAGGLVIMTSHPFFIGDFIEVSGISGTVEEISLNHTKLTTPDGLRVLLPNQELASSRVTNYTVLGTRRVAQKICASYETPTEAVKAACYEALAQTANTLEDPAPVVRLSNYGESSIQYTVYCWATVENYWEVHFALAENLRTAFAKNGVKMTYNHLNVHVTENRS